MSSIKIRDDKIHTEYEIPTVSIISEGDKLIKDLANKQLNKNIRLQEELSRIKQFENPTELVNETEYLAGKNNLTEFKQHAEYLQNLQELKCSGLTNEEIELYLDNKKGLKYVLAKHKNICQSILQDQLERIFSKLRKKEEHSDRKSSETISRHIKEIALTTKPNSLETKLFKFASSCSSKDETNNTPLYQPINSLIKLEKDLFGHLSNPHIPSLKKRRKKAKKFLDSDDSTDINSDTIFNTSPFNSTSKTKWDVQELPKNEQLKNKEILYTCASKRKYTIKDNEIIRIDSTGFEENKESSMKGHPFISEKIIWEQNVEKKLTEEEIKKLPKFHNYENGTPTKVLFIKNLAKQTNEEDLIKLFSCFNNENNKIIYRLLTGKMKGQAFITFNSVDQATKALESVNGTIIKNKPIIIQYGKSA